MNIQRPILLKSLVGISLALLLLFLSYWNFDNYKREKEELRQELTDKMTLACSAYRDSVVQNIFKRVKFNVTGEQDDMQFSSIVSHQISGDGNQSFVLRSERLDTTIVPPNMSHLRDTMVTIVVESGDTHIHEEDIIAWRDQSSASLRLEFVEDTINERIVIFDQPLSDTTKLRRDRTFFDVPNVYKKIDSIYSGLLDDADLSLSHEVVLDGAHRLPSDEEWLAIEYTYDSFGEKNRPHAVFSNYRGFLLQKMSAPILMSLLLFSVVASSFIAILKSWLSQIRLTKVKNEFVSNMTHELKTPIATIGVALEALDNFGALDDERKRSEYLEISKHEVNRLGLLVDKVLKMSTLDQGLETMAFTSVDVKQLTEGMLKSMKLHLDKHNAILDYNVSGSDFLVSGDKVHLTNVLYNLIDNAIKYSPDHPEINVSLNESNGGILIRIADKGIGIPVEYQSKVFDRFFRVPTGDRHNVKGHGLGLHYVNTIIEKHGGAVSIESQKDSGTTFTINLPKSND